MITCRSPQEIVNIRVSAQLAAATLQHITPMIQPGVTTFELDRAAEAYIRKHRGLPAFKGYRGFPATLCRGEGGWILSGRDHGHRSSGCQPQGPGHRHCRG